MSNYNRYTTTSIPYNDILQHLSSTSSITFTDTWCSTSCSALPNEKYFKVKERPLSLLRLYYNKKIGERI